MFSLLLSKLSFIRKNTLLTAAGLFMIASMAANGFNWILNIMAGRWLDAEDFATYAVFISLLGLISVPANALSTTVSRYYAFLTGKEDYSGIKDLTNHFGKLALILGIAGIAGVFLINDFIQDFLYLPSNRMVIGFAPVALFLFTAAYFRGILKGRLRFGLVGLMILAEAFIKVLLLASGHFLDFSLLTVAIISLPISWFTATLIGVWGTFWSKTKSTIHLTKSEFSKADSYFFMTNAFFASVGMMLMNSVDILLVKHFFSDFEAGTYALLTLFGKILYFGAGTFIELFVPLTAISFAKNSQSRRQFIKLLGLVSSIALPTLAFFLLFPEFIVKLFLKEKGLLVLPYFAPYILATVFLLYTNCFNAYNSAKKHFFSTYLITIMALIQGVLIYFWHNSLYDIVYIVLITQSLLFAIVVLYEFLVFPKTPPPRAKSQLDLKTLLWITIRNKFKTETIEYAIPPKNIQQYHLTKVLETPGLKRPHLIAFYKNGSSKAVAKIWHGKEKNLSYFALKHEAHVYQIINKILSEHKSKLPKTLQNISIPDFINFSETSDTVILLTEYVDGKLVRDLSTTQKINIYFNAKQFIQFVGNHITPEDRNIFGKRSLTDFLLLFPLLLGVSIFRQPKHIWQLLLAGLTFLKSTPLLAINKPLVLVHRDLHNHNLLFKNGRTSIIDLQGCVYSFPEYEYATSLPIEWNDQPFRNQALEKINRTSPLSKASFKGLLANFTIHGLTANNLPAHHIERYLKVLHYITTGKSASNTV